MWAEVRNFRPMRVIYALQHNSRLDIVIFSALFAVVGLGAATTAIDVVQELNREDDWVCGNNSGKATIAHNFVLFIEKNTPGAAHSPDVEDADKSAEPLNEEQSASQFGLAP